MSCLLVIRDKNKKTDKMPKLGSLYKNTLYAKVTKVSQWAEQSGLSYPINLSTTKTWYTLHSSKKNGIALELRSKNIVSLTC